MLHVRPLALAVTALLCLLGTADAAAIYDPGTGRFLQRDPSGYPDGMNAYAGYHAMWGGLDPTGLSGGPNRDPGGHIRRTRELNDRWREERRQHNRDRYIYNNNYQDGLRAFADLSEKISEKCESCCCENCSVEECKRNAQSIENAVLQAWEEWWGQDKGIQHRPVPPQPSDGVDRFPQHCGGYFCYDWSVILSNAVKSGNQSGCVSVEAIRYYYLGFGDDAVVYRFADGTEVYKLHAFVDIYVCKNLEECRLSIDDGFLLDGFIHDSDWPDDRSLTDPPVDGRPVFETQQPGDSTIPMAE